MKDKLEQLKRNMTFVMAYLFLSIVAFVGLIILRSDIGPASTIALLVIIPNFVLLVIVFWTFIGKDKSETEIIN